MKVIPTITMIVLIGAIDNVSAKKYYLQTATKVMLIRIMFKK